MSIAKKIAKFLQTEQVSYQHLEHPVAYTASEIAGQQHVPGSQFVKSVIVKADNNYVMCVLPAIHLVDFDKLKKLLKAKDVQIASEEELSTLFPDYELGAEPPFGNLYGLPMFVDRYLEGNEEIIFNAGTHTDTIRMHFLDFKKLTNPTVCNLGSHI